MESTTVKKRDVLRKTLIWGDMARVARLAEVNRETVNRWFKGENNNPVVAAMVVAVIEARNETIKSKIAQFVSQ